MYITPCSSTLIHSSTGFRFLAAPFVAPLPFAADVGDGAGWLEAAFRFSRKELTNSVFDFSIVGFRMTCAPAVMMLPVLKMHRVAIFNGR
jgi:hypothetical protein